MGLVPHPQKIQMPKMWQEKNTAGGLFYFASQLPKVRLSNGASQNELDR